MTPWAEEKQETVTAKGGAIMAAELVVPGVYATRNWGEMSGGEKAFIIVLL